MVHLQGLERRQRARLRDETGELHTRQKYPVAFLIHGGPQDAWTNDFHGSSGYGQAFTDAISQHWGDRPLEDLKKGWAAALEKYDFLDGDHACALGTSYGGYMVYWMAGVWNTPWKCFRDSPPLPRCNAGAYRAGY